MKKVVLLIILLLTGVSTLLHAQESMESGIVLIKGTVTDETGSPVEIANIWVPRQMKGTTTDLKGEYTLRIATSDTVEISYSMIGYPASAFCTSLQE